MLEFKHDTDVRRGCGEQRRLWPSLHISEWCPSPSFRSISCVNHVYESETLMVALGYDYYRFSN